MFTITLPNGAQKQFNAPVSVKELAASISPTLAKKSLAAKVDEKLVDTSYLLQTSATVQIITEDDEAGLEILRHSTAHLLAHAVKELYPEAQVTIGPVIEDGFYYDFAYPAGFSEADLAAIETKMHEIAKQNYPVIQKVMNREDAIAYFRDQGEDYKIKIIESIPQQETLTFYQQNGFMDLCRGPHVPSTGKLKVFKLMKVAGAYWRGDSKNEMLQRIYGTAWAKTADQELYLHRLAEAEKRDHRRIGKALDLFHLQEEAPGMVFWHANGWIIYQLIEQYIREKLKQYDYQEIRTPQIASRSLWEKSGHWEKFHNEMFITVSEERTFAIKPMSCPCHVQVYNQGIRSYRDLPLRFAEFGSCHRDEPSGALHGLMRVRHLVQDDGHIFCTQEQIQSEIEHLIDLIYAVYRDFGFNDIIVKLSTRPEERVGSDEIWSAAEHALEVALNQKGVAWDLAPGEGAFYGPKIEFKLRDCLGRVWQCGTIQLDFNMPERLDAKYIAENNSRQVPVMIHRAIIGSFERFIGVLIEHYAGVFPTWLAPTQVVVMNITDKQQNYVDEIVQKLKQHGFRAKTDTRNEKIGFKIREHTLQRIPYIIVIGEKEMQANTLSVRKRNGEDLGSMSLENFFKLLSEDVAQLGILV